MIGRTELLVIAGLVVLLFGASRIPGVARAIGQGLRELKKGLRGKDGEAADEGDASPPKKPPRSSRRK